MTYSIKEKLVHPIINTISNHAIAFVVLLSIFLYFIWEFSQFIISTIFRNNQEIALAFSFQEFANSVIISLLLFFFVFIFQRREYAYFEKLDMIHSGIIKTSNFPYVVSYTNHKLLDILGYKEMNELTRLSLSSLFPTYADQIHYFLNNNTIESIENIETEIFTKEGEILPVLVSGTRIFNYMNKERNIFMVITNIKGLKDAQNQIKHLMDVEKNTVINHLVQKVGHEINNPLSFMMYDTERLIEYVQEMTAMIKIYEEVNNKLSSELQLGIKDDMESIETIKKSMNFEHALTDLDDILTSTKEGLSRIAKVVKDVRAYPYTLSEALPQSLNNIIKLTVELVKNQYIQSNITIITNLDKNIPNFPLKAGEIAQALLNLILNSIQAIKEKSEEGIIKIDTKELKNETNTKSFVQLSIEDNGIGIQLNKSDLNKIFNTNYTTKKDGTGLGLSISRKIISDHNGTINIESEYNVGTKFIIDFSI